MRTLNDLIFDGRSLSELGVTVSQKNALDSPQRDVKIYEVPGRNGNIIIDNGRYKNASVTYHVNVEDGMDVKAENIRDFLHGINGDGYYKYKTLRDTYNPDEFRYAVYSGDIKFDVGVLLRTGECDLTFNCKPQRFLYSGNNKISYEGKGEKIVTTLTAAQAKAKWISKVPESAAHYGDVFDKLSAYNFIEFDLKKSDVNEDLRITIYVPEVVGERISTPCVSVLSVDSDGGIKSGKWMYISSGHEIEFAVLTKSWPDDASQVYAFVPDIPGVYIKAVGLTTGNEYTFLDISYNGAETIVNPTNEKAYPLIDIEITSAVNDVVLAINSIPITVNLDSESLELLESNTLTIDTERMDAYSGSRNMNKYVSFYADLFLKPDDNDIYIGSCTSATITPRWYKI